MEVIKEAREIYTYRELLRNLIVTDIKKRYKKSVLGFLWVMLDPLLMMLVFYVAFSGLFGRDVNNYAAYVICGIATWQFFSQSTKTSASVFSGKGSLISKIYIPKSIFPYSQVLSGLIHFIFSFIALLGIVMISGTKLSAGILMVPLVISEMIIFILGLSLLLSTLSVMFQDVLFIYDVILKGWMFLTPIFYPLRILPQWVKDLIVINPLYHYVTLMRACIYDTSVQKADHFAWGLFFALLSFIIGWLVYNRLKDRLIFYL